MDIGKAFTFVRDDPRGPVKLLIGGLLCVAVVLSIITVVGWIFLLAIIYGYLVRLTRNVIAGAEYPLPEWDDWGGLLRDGWGAFVPQFLLGLAIVLCAFPLLLPGMALAASTSASAQGIGSVLIVAAAIGEVALGVLLALAQPLIVGQYATTGSIRAALNVRDLATLLRRSIATYLIVLLLGIITGMIGQLGIIACGIGLPFTTFYAQLVNHQLYGQAYLDAHNAVPADIAPGHPSASTFPI